MKIVGSSIEIRDHLTVTSVHFTFFYQVSSVMEIMERRKGSRVIPLFNGGKKSTWHISVLPLPFSHCTHISVENKILSALAKQLKEYIAL